MKWKIMAKTVAFLQVLFGLEALPVDAENKQMSLTPEQEAKAKAALGADYEAVRDSINAELKQMAANDFDLKAIEDELEAARKLLALKTDADGNVPEAERGDLSINAQVTELKAQITKTMADYEAKFQKMVAEGVGDTGKVIDMGKRTKLNHSATHFSGDGEQWNAFEGRPWNEHGAGIKAGVSNFNTTVDIPLLSGDIEHFVRKNPTMLESIFNDNWTLPKEWAKQTGIIDRIVNGMIAPSEVTQANNGGWNPKGEVLIEAEEGRVFDKKIDLTFTGAKLKLIEKSWISWLNGNDGSHPWKTTFVGFLLGEFIKQAALDSTIAMINGLYVKNPSDVTGMNVNSQNGIRAFWYYFRDVKHKYTPFDMGDPTPQNIVDYVKDMIELIPEKDRGEQGWEIQLSDQLFLWYKEKAGELYTLQYATDKGKSNYDGATPINYPQFKFQPLRHQTNTLFIGITKSDNVEQLQYLENEKNQFTLTHEKRDTHIFADFKEGIRFKQVGHVRTGNEPVEFGFQKLYSNSCPIFDSSVKVPLFYRGSTTIALNDQEFYPNFYIAKDDYPANIEAVTGVVAGQIVTITGRATLGANRLVKNNANIIIGSDFALNTGGTLTMVVGSDLKLRKLTATTAPAAAPETDKTFNTATIDAKTGTIFRNNSVADLTVTSIINGVDGKTIRIYGTDETGIEVTIADAATIDVASTAVLAAATDYLDLTRVNGVWIESGRLIA